MFKSKLFWLVIAGAGAIWLLDKKGQKAVNRQVDAHEDAVIDGAASESFPASDPPAWTPSGV